MQNQRLGLMTTTERSDEIQESGLPLALKPPFRNADKGIHRLLWLISFILVFCTMISLLQLMSLCKNNIWLLQIFTDSSLVQQTVVMEAIILNLLNVMHSVVVQGINFIIRFVSILGCLCFWCGFYLTSDAVK